MTRWPLVTEPASKNRARGLSALFVLLAILSLLGWGATFDRQRRESFQVLNGLPDPDLDPRPNPFGINADLDQYEDPGPALDAIHALGVTWVRQTFAWDAIEPRRGEFEWARWDRIVAAAVGRDLRLMAVLRYSPAWARASADRNSPPADARAFAGFAAAFADRYGDRIDAYQIWDEPNLSSAWGGPPNPAGYASLLQAAHAAVHAADPIATVVLAGLAPTVETGPDNLSDLLFLRRLYEIGAAPYFDAAAGKPYGFSLPPDDRTADPSVLNFSRFALLRAEMEAHADSRKLLWGTSFGWNSLPADWSGANSIWGQVAEATQAEFTDRAYRRAVTEWPWAGPLILDAFDPNVPPSDPHLGFSVLRADGTPRPVAEALRALTAEIGDRALPGTHTALDPAASYFGAWEFSDLGADIPEDYQDARMAVEFSGTDAALRVRRADYRGHLYVSVDGQPANALPRDERGAYLVLTAPELEAERVSVPIAWDLPPGPHTLEVRPDRGWDQWALAGFSIGYRSRDAGPRPLSAGLLGLSVLFILAGLYSARRADWLAPARVVRGGLDCVGGIGQVALAAGLSALLCVSAWLTWGSELAAVSRRFGDGLPLLVTAATAGLFYYSPWFLLTLACAVLLLVLFFVRLDLAFALIAFSLPFYLHPRPLFDKAFSMAELLTLLAVAAWGLRLLAGLRQRVEAGRADRTPIRRSLLEPMGWMDWGTIALVAVSAASMLGAEVRGVAIREFRVAILEPALFYLLLRTTRLDRAALWRVMDGFVLGALVVAGIGLYQQAFGVDLITAEGGVERIRSVFGSPNNVGLYLGRAAGPLAALALMGRARRRWAYLAAAVVLGLALRYTYSKGALLLGVPAALAVVLLFWGGRRALWLGLAGLAAFAAALVPLSRNPRFAGLLDLARGTSFFRVKLWQATLSMIRDHPLLGFGPDNFLYAYRGKYILPEAWAEPNLSHPHNVVLDYAARLGLIGLAAGAALQIGFWQTALDALRRLRDDPDLRALTVGLMASMADFLAHGLVDLGFFVVDLSFVFFLTLGVSARVRELGS